MTREREREVAEALARAKDRTLKEFPTWGDYREAHQDRSLLAAELGRVLMVCDPEKLERLFKEDA